MSDTFLVGANFGKDVSKDFIKGGKWILGWQGNENHKQYKSMLRIFNQVKIGDDLVIKSTYTKKKNLPFDNQGRFVSVMKIKAVGKVTKLVGDGHTILVDWDKSFKEREWFFYTHRPTMWKLPNIENDEKAQKLYNFIFKDEKQEFSYFMNFDDDINQEVDEVSEDDIYVDSLKSSHNIIFHGAPGTGKTYLAKRIAADMIGCSIDKLNDSEQFDFVQFHPNYDYSDFVEGLRPVNHDGTIGFERRNGIFMNFCEKAKSSAWVGGQDNFDEAWNKFINSVLDADDYYSVKTLNGKEMHLQAFERNGITGVTEKDSTSRYYNRDQCYKVYLGLAGVPKGGFDNYRKAIINHLKENFGLKEYERPQESYKNEKPYIFVIDEINRGDISKIFGELFFSIDPSYRGINGAVTTQFSNLYDGTDGKNLGDKFYIPENVYIIGTMNDIDRSVDSFDFAMRRRFRFIEIKAKQRLSMLEELDEEKREEAEFRLLNLNRSISATEGLSESYHVGPSYFLKLKDLDYNYDALWSDYIKPLLVEYLRGSYDFQEILGNLEDAYNTIDDTGDADESDGQ